MTHRKPPDARPGIEVRPRRERDGTEYWVYRVRWLSPDGTKRASTFDSERDALDFQAQLRLLRRGGELASLDTGRETLAELVGEWWRDYASRNLERSTLKVYVSLWNCHALPRLGHLEVRRITPRVIAGFRADLEDAGVGPSSIRKTMAMLQGVFARAMELDRARFNPLTPVRKPRAARKRAIAALAPVAVERIRALLRGDGRHAEATLVSVLAYAGLRPQEALALEWRHVRRRTLLIETP